MSAIYNAQKSILDEKEENIKDLEKEYKELMAARANARYEREKAERVEDHINQAATLIQTVWRAYRVDKYAAAAAKKRMKGLKK
jgi:hypothetical protein